MNAFFQIPPLHPILVHFPLALLPLAFACDVLGRITGRLSLCHAAWWALLFATITTPLTTISGWRWLSGMGEMVHGQMPLHQWLGTIIPILLVPLTLWRYRFHARSATSSVPYLIVATGMLLAVTVQGHIGGMMSFGGDGSSNMTSATMTSHADDPHHNNPATTSTNENDGWSDSIRVKEHQHE